MGPLELVKLPALMERNTGKPEVSIGLIDGPVATQHPDLLANTSARCPERTAPRAHKPIGSPACTEPLSPEFCSQSGIPLLPPFAPTARS